MILKLLLADDHAILREGLKGLIQAQSDMQVVAEAATGREAVRMTRREKPDVVVMDISMPDMNGIDATREIKEFFPECKIIVLSMHSEEHFITQAIQAGAAGYLLKNSVFEEFIGAVRTVAADKAYFSPAVATTIVGYVKKAPTTENVGPSSELTPRERQVLQLIAEGKRTKDIAVDLGIGSKTIEGCRTAIMNKLNLHTVAELTKYAIRNGITSINY